MSDWGLYELDDIVWDVFQDSSDCLVPHPDVEFKDSKSPYDDDKKVRPDLVHGVTESNNENKERTEENVSQNNSEGGVPSFLIEGESQAMEHCSSHASLKGLYPGSFSSECINKEITLASESTIAGPKEDESGNACFNGSVLEDSSIVEKCSLDSMPVCFSSADNSLDFITNEAKATEDGDILDYEWPDIGNFEDVDQLLSGCSEFGQVRSGTANELSWFSSSSYAHDGSDVALKSDFQSSYVDLTVFRDPLEDNEANLVDWPENGEVTMSSFKSSHLEYGSYGQWLGADNQGEDGFSSKGMLNDCGNANGSNIYDQAQSTIDNSISSCEGPNAVNLQSNTAKSVLPQVERKKKAPKSEVTDSKFHQIPITLVQSTERSIPQTCQPLLNVKPNNPVGPDSSHSLYSYDLHLKTHNTKSTQKTSSENQKLDTKAKKEHNAFSSDKISTQSYPGHQLLQEMPCLSLMSPRDGRRETEETHTREKLHRRLATCDSTEHTANPTLSSNQSSCQENLVKLQNIVEGDIELEDASRDSLLFETSHTSKHENSEMMQSKNILSDPIGLQQLQDVMGQLDLRIKLCIRDGLYRLARNAEQRHGVDGAISCFKASAQGAGLKKSERCPGFIDMETGTNQIDRSIAQLLFYRPEQSPSLADDALSFESHIMSEQNHGPAYADHLISSYQPSACNIANNGGSMDS